MDARQIIETLVKISERSVEATGRMAGNIKVLQEKVDRLTEIADKSLNKASETNMLIEGLDFKNVALVLRDLMNELNDLKESNKEIKKNLENLKTDTNGISSLDNGILNLGTAISNLENSNKKVIESNTLANKILISVGGILTLIISLFNIFGKK